MTNKELKEKTKTDNRTHAQKRKEEKKEALRDYITGRNYIDQINNDLKRDDITNEELPVIKFKTETRLKLLNKVLPDLKAVEHSGNEDKPVFAMLLPWLNPSIQQRN